MEIHNFKDLTGFMYGEYEKMSEIFGIEKTPKRTIRFVERALRKRTKLYDKPLLLKEKRRLALDIAFDTMPHGFLWKIFHSKLWKKMKSILEQESLDSVVEPEETLEDNPVIQVPAVIVEKEFVQVPVTVENDSFDEDFAE